MENFRCLTKDSNNKAIYSPWHRGNVVEMGVSKCLVGVTIPWYIVKMPPLGKSKESARVFVRPWFGETNPYWHDPISPPQLAQEVYDYCERLRNCLVAETLPGRRGWVWSPATIVSPLGAPIVIKYKPGSLAAEQYGSQLVHASYAVPDTQDAMRSLSGMGQFIG